MNKLLLDTNIFIYAKDRSSVYHEWSNDLVTQPFEFYTSSKNLSEYFAVVTKGGSPLLSVKEALEDLKEIKNLCKILYSSEQSHSKLISLISQYQPRGLLIHDFEIASIALANDIKIIATINKKDFKKIDEVEIWSIDS